MDQLFAYKTAVTILTVTIRYYVLCDGKPPNTDYDLYRLVSAFQTKYNSTDGSEYTDPNSINKTEEIFADSIYPQNFHEDPLRRSIKKLFREKDKTSKKKTFLKVGDFVKSFRKNIKSNNGENMVFAFMGDLHKKSDRRSHRTVQHRTKQGSNKLIERLFDRKKQTSVPPSKSTSKPNAYEGISLSMESKDRQNPGGIIPMSDRSESSIEVEEAIKDGGIFKQIGISETSIIPRFNEFQEKGESIRFQSNISKGKDKFNKISEGNTGESRRSVGSNGRKINSASDRSIGYLQTRERSREKWNQRSRILKTSSKTKRRWPALGIPKSDTRRGNIATTEWPSTSHGIFDEVKYLEIEIAGKTRKYADKEEFNSNYIGTLASEPKPQDAVAGKLNLSRSTNSDRSRREYSQNSIQPTENATQIHKTGGQDFTNSGGHPFKHSATKHNINNEEIDKVLKKILSTAPTTRTEKNILKALKMALTRFKDPSLALEILLDQ